VDPTPANTTLAPERSRSTSTTATAQPIPWIEHHVGECVAAAGCAILQALDEHKDGSLMSSTKSLGGDTIFALFRLHQYLAGHLDFEAVARREGAAALRAACDGEMSPATIDVLVDGVLDILAKVVRAELN
jgi:hypothetical protein